ncbi:MAG: DegT/DnrJ/EryC1/StrS family aminotransferase [bacterium]
MEERLAIDGGTPVTTKPLPSTLHGVEEIGEEEIEAVVKVLRSHKIFRFLNPPEESATAQLEAKYRESLGVKYALAVTGGTTALIAGLVGIGVGSGDEVIIPAHTYIASAAAVLTVGAIPVIAEIDNSLTMDPKDAERKITPHTRAIMPVHMRGTPCRMDEIMEVARKHNLLVIEDVAQANGGSYKGRKLGSIGDVGCFSLQHYKVITAGEGGMVVTNDRKVFDRAACQHDSAMHFWKPGESTIDPFPGENYRMCEMRGALGLVQFSRMEGILRKLRARKKRIVEGIKDIPGIELQDVPDPEGECAVWVAFFLENSDLAKKFSEALAAEGIKNGTIFNKEIPDRHIYYYWDYVMNKISRDRHGCPWTCQFYKGNVKYSRDMCPQTLDYLGRTIAIFLGQKLEFEDADLIVKGIRKVAKALL